MVKLCELAQELQLETVTSTNDYEQSHLILFPHLCVNFLSRKCKQKTRHRSCTHISHASFHSIYTVGHITNHLKAWAYPYYCERRFIYMQLRQALLTKPEVVVPAVYVNSRDQ